MVEPGFKPRNVSACRVLLIITLRTASHVSMWQHGDTCLCEQQRPVQATWHGPSQLLHSTYYSKGTGEAVTSKTSFTKACGQQVGLPDEAFYFLNLAPLGEPDVTVGHSSPTSHLWVPQSSSWQTCPWFPENIRKEGIAIHIWQVGKLRLRGLSNLSKLSTVLGLKSWSTWLLSLHVPKRLEALEPKGNTPGILMKFRPKGKIFLLPLPLFYLPSLRLVCSLVCTWFHRIYWGKRKRRWMWRRGLLERCLSWWRLWVLVLVVGSFFRADDSNCLFLI